MKMNLNKAKLNGIILASGLILALGCRNESSGGNDKEDPTPTVIKHTLTITKPTGGTLISDAGGINCGSKATTCKAEFDKDTEVTLTATPDANYVAGTWGDVCSDTNAGDVISTCTLTINANKTVRLTFSLAQRELAIKRPTGGTVTSKPPGIKCGDSNMGCIANFDHGTLVTLTAVPSLSNTIESWGDACLGTKSAAATCMLNMDESKGVELTFTAGVADTDRDGEPDATDVDDDNDGLIEVHNLDMLNNIRNNMDGTSYRTAFPGADNRKGAPEVETDDCKTATMDGGKSFYLCGYELMRDLDFADEKSYAGNTINSAWRPNDKLDNTGNSTTPDMAKNLGFDRIGSDSIGVTAIPNFFRSIFEGNGYSISNLYQRNADSLYYGLFGRIDSGASIRNLGVVDVNLYGRLNSPTDIVGILVGLNEGSITASYATGNINARAALQRQVGGLVGYNASTGSITVSYASGNISYTPNNINSRYKHISAFGGLVGWNEGSITDSHTTGTGNVNSSDRDGNRVGGLVGWNASTGNILTSYATGTGSVNGGARDDYVGGLVGLNEGSITASYATSTGDVNGGTGDEDRVGGLVGWNKGSILASYATSASNITTDITKQGAVGGLVGYNEGDITASYATGVASGSAGDDNVGGLAGYNEGEILASFATGALDGGDGADNVGGLVGWNKDKIMASYATGVADGGAGDYDYAGGLVGKNSAGRVIASYATGDVDGGAGMNNHVGALVGGNYGTVKVSYAFGSGMKAGRGHAGTAHPAGLGSISDKSEKVNALTAPGGGDTSVDAKWNEVSKNTLGAWDFGSGSQAPALEYADYDGTGGTDYCALFPDKIPGTDVNIICGTTLLPRQR